MRTIAAITLLLVLAGCSGAGSGPGTMRVATGVDADGNVIYRTVFKPHADAETPQNLCEGCVL